MQAYSVIHQAGLVSTAIRTIVCLRSAVREPNVGLLKFMSYARKHLPRQQLCSLSA